MISFRRPVAAQGGVGNVLANDEGRIMMVDVMGKVPGEGVGLVRKMRCCE